MPDTLLYDAARGAHASVHVIHGHVVPADSVRAARRSERQRAERVAMQEFTFAVAELSRRLPALADALRAQAPGSRIRFDFFDDPDWGIAVPSVVFDVVTDSGEFDDATAAVHAWARTAYFAEIPSEVRRCFGAPTTGTWRRDDALPPAEMVF